MRLPSETIPGDNHGVRACFRIQHPAAATGKASQMGSKVNDAGSSRERTSPAPRAVEASRLTSIDRSPGEVEGNSRSKYVANPHLDPALQTEDRQETETHIAKEQPPEIPDELDEFDMMREFLENRSQMDPALLIPYIGEFIAWSPDGKRIVAHAKDHATLRKLIREAGENPRHCVVGGFDGDIVV